MTELPSALEEQGNSRGVHSFLLLCRVINFSGFCKNISKCYLTLSWKIGRKQRHGMPSLCPFSVFLATLSLFIAYVKKPMRSCQTHAVKDWRQGLQRRLTPAWNQRVLQACDFPILTAEGLIKYFRNISVLFYLPEGKGHVNQP